MLCLQALPCAHKTKLIARPRPNRRHTVTIFQCYLMQQMRLYKPNIHIRNSYRSVAFHLATGEKRHSSFSLIIRIAFLYCLIYSFISITSPFHCANLHNLVVIYISNTIHHLTVTSLRGKYRYRDSNRVRNNKPLAILCTLVGSRHYRDC